MKVDVHVKHDEERDVWYVSVDRRDIGPFYMKDVATDIAFEIKRVINVKPECDLRKAAHEKREAEMEAARIEREKERQRQNEARERAEEERQEKIRESILRAAMLSDIDLMDFDAIVYAHDGRTGYGRSRDWRVAVYADEHIELLDEDGGAYNRYRDGKAKGTRVMEAKEEHDERVISIAQDFESAQLERKGSKVEREYLTRFRVYDKKGRRSWAKSKGDAQWMYAKDVNMNHGLGYKKGDRCRRLYQRDNDEAVPAEFDTEDEATAWAEAQMPYGYVVSPVKKPVRKGATK